MASKKRGLGRSLDALLNQSSTAAQVSEPVDKEVKAPASIEGETSANELVYLPIKAIHANPKQPRRHFDETELAELATSIQTHGIIQPIVVRAQGRSKYEIIAGERRYRAAKLAALKTIPAIVKDVTEDDALALALIENIQRSDLNAIEQALAVERLVEEYSLTHQQIAEVLGVARTSISNLLRLLKLPAEIQDMIVNKQLEMGHARSLLSLPIPKQLELAQLITSQRLSVRQAEERARLMLAGDEVKKVKRAVDPDIERLEHSLSQKLGAKVQIKHNVKGRGKLSIRYKNLEQLEQLLEFLQ